MRYRAEHLKIKFVSTSGHVIFFLLYNEREIKGILAIPEDFRTFSQDFQRFLKILRTLSEVIGTFPVNFRKCPSLLYGMSAPGGRHTRGDLVQGLVPSTSHIYTRHIPRD